MSSSFFEIFYFFCCGFFLIYSLYNLCFSAAAFGYTPFAISIQSPDIQPVKTLGQGTEVNGLTGIADV